MSKRILKQAIIGFLTVIFLFSIGGGFYLIFRPDPTCFDNKKNQGEEDIDCGGPCPSCEIKTLLPLEVSDILFFPYQDKVDLAAKVLNKNLEWGVKNFQYEFILIGDDNQKQKISAEDFILPGEIKYLVISPATTTFSPIREVKINILTDSLLWGKPAPEIFFRDKPLFTLTNLIIKKPKITVDVSLQERRYIFTKTLRLGSRGEEVWDLQKVLSKDPVIYPQGRITGFYGKLTEDAVKRFQKKYGIRVTGEVGPQTRAKLNELFGKEILVEEGFGPHEATLEVSGDVYNNTPFSFRYAEVSILLCGKGGKYLGVGKIPVFNLASLKSVSFVMRWRSPFLEEVTICEKTVTTNIFDSKNVSLK